MAGTLFFSTSLLILSAGIARFNKDTLVKSVGVLCATLIYCAFCFIVFGKLQGFLPSQSVEQFISQHGYDASRLPIAVSNFVQLALIGGCVFNLFTVLAIWWETGFWKYCIVTVLLFCLAGVVFGPVIGQSPICSLFGLCCAFMASVSWGLGLTYAEFCVIGNIWIPCAAIIGTSSFLVYASWRYMRSHSGMTRVWPIGTIVFAFLQIIGAMLLLHHYAGTMHEAFYRCVQDLKLLAALAHTSYEAVNIFLWVFIGTSLLTFNIYVGRCLLKRK